MEAQILFLRNAAIRLDTPNAFGSGSYLNISTNDDTWAFNFIYDRGDEKYENTSWHTKGNYDGNKKVDWMDVVAIFKRYGWSWGGDWKTLVDIPHVEKSFGYTVKQFNALHQTGKMDKQGYVLP